MYVHFVLCVCVCGHAARLFTELLTYTARLSYSMLGYAMYMFNEGLYFSLLSQHKEKNPIT